MVLDALRLAVGTLTALPVRPPIVADRSRAGLAMMLAPLAVLPIALGVGAVMVLGSVAHLAPLVTAVLAAGVAVLGSRALHFDGLSDVADGLTASYDPERSLQVMKSGTSGPAGVVATVVVFGAQAAALAALAANLTSGSAAAIAAASLCASRAVLVLCCLPGVRPARADGLGVAFIGTVSPAAAVVTLVITGAALTWLTWSAGCEPWLAAAALSAAAVATGVIVAKATRRFGGVTGDVLGACVEVGWAAILVVLS